MLDDIVLNKGLCVVSRGVTGEFVTVVSHEPYIAAAQQANTSIFTIQNVCQTGSRERSHEAKTTLLAANITAR